MPAASMDLWKSAGVTVTRRICCSCAAVSVTFCGLASAGAPASGLAPHALRAASVIAARTDAARAREGDLVCMGVLGQIWAAPPSAAERLIEGDGVGEAGGLGLHEGDAGLLVALFGAQQRQVAGVARAVLAFRQVERALRGVGGGG